ncbi:MAG: hypothetical protein KDJ22_01250 [Candidatus Competibacteraceae bacterium]|nr:hypothetical protein [Candidatus Competibacteraceae bacterium]MCP5124212.1 hypothetical protein [Gammaproteobacteria bacterium]HRX70189.1 hypothetical protein [Candidatus Competibacteraceae bacterium]
MALKKAEDSWVIDSQGFVDDLEKLPESGKQSADAASSSQPAKNNALPGVLSVCA